MKVNGKPPITLDSASAAGLGYIGVADADARVLDRIGFHSRRFQGESSSSVDESEFRIQNSELARGCIGWQPCFPAA